MECKVSDLVKRGHDQSAELKASCGAVDVRDVAQLISDLATQLDVQLARSNSLAAENALLKKSEPAPFSKLMMEALDVYQVGADEVPELAMLSAYKKLREGLKTPATDAFLAEVRAQGVEMFAANEMEWAAHWEKHGVKDGSVSRCIMVAQDAEKFAAQLRKGVQS
ncbi:hypothetical protein N8U65_00510 [Enterobacter hormaechei subsp. steigerwaltii]|nr:hypothetical protein [Enterobacter hormaechei]MCU2413946.1 hypothetical protein [Enterobacter hormaechei subsp. steigerwaltii]MCU2975530.1 hypothetical protein [Enterobacter hormaechei subsp. steigerwaltii]MCU3093593.1 hypothetical protein [Enterobacter hormaechei subsp. steigerwaltii]MCU3216223.1 hypothetical protein [Enterobacter hormaechei subsp. steigerwaltii]